MCSLDCRKVDRSATVSARRIRDAVLIIGVKQAEKGELRMKRPMTYLDQWIDSSTGDIKASLTRGDEQLLIDEVLRLGVDDLLWHLLLHSPPPYAMERSGLRIKLSEEIRETKAEVYPGVSDIREDRDDSREIEYPADTREIPWEHRAVLLGEFKTQGRNGTIYLYTRAMAACNLAAKLGFETLFWATLAHNMFYAFLYNQLKNGGKVGRWRSGAKRDRETVKASLASYFEGAFLGFPQISGYLESEWESLDVEGWPSSGALAILRSNKSDRLFGELYNMSFYDWKTAADILRTGYWLNSSRIRQAIV